MQVKATFDKYISISENDGKVINQQSNFIYAHITMELLRMY